MGDSLGLTEAVAMALGGMIGGGIYLNSPDVLGLVAVVAVAVVGIELLYFERALLADRLPTIGGAP